MRIVLTGFMGAGKTTVGRLLARRLEWPFVDLDAEIERRAGASIRELFERRGEARFRELEKSVFAEVLTADPAVIAAGGGTLTFADNLELARARAVVVWLNPSYATIVARIGAKGKMDRPLFRDETGGFDLFRERLPAYAQADLKIDVGANEAAEEVASRLALRIEERACTT